MNPLDENVNLIDPSSVSSKPLAMRHGLLWALAAIVLGLVGYLLGWSDQSDPNVIGSLILGLASFGIGVAMIFLPIKKLRDELLGGYMTLGKGFMAGFMTAVVYALITMVWTFVFLSFIAPEIASGTADQMVAQWEAQGLSDDEIEGMSWLTDLFSNPLILSVFSALMGIIWWSIVSLVISAVMKKDPPRMA